MNTHYTTDRSTQMVLSILKAYGIKKIVASPGTTNMAFVASAQSDPYFEMYSSVDERSAAYIACGLAQESGGGSGNIMHRSYCIERLYARADRSIL